MIKAVVFDLDGTLLDRDSSVKKFIKEQYRRLDKSVNHIPMDTYMTRFIELDNRGYVWKDKVYRQLVEEFEITEWTWEELLQDYLSHFQASCVPFPNLLKMLETLKEKSIALGMITNGKGQFQMDNIKALHIKTYFDSILISEWEGMKKPEPQLFQKSLDELHVSPSESMFVGDHPEKDVEAARRTGMKGVWKKDAQWENVRADFTIEDLGEIPFLIEKLNNPYL